MALDKPGADTSLCLLAGLPASAYEYEKVGGRGTATGPLRWNDDKGMKHP
jgi:hypothetical protein